MRHYNEIEEWEREEEEQSVIESATFYHGTTDALAIDGELQSALDTGNLREDFRTKLTDKVFVTDSLKSAQQYAVKAAQKYGGNPIVYEVEPNRDNMIGTIQSEYITDSAKIKEAVWVGTKEIKIDLPKEVETIINKLEEKGFEAYAVGGCVRDSILGLNPQDWDICTSATPQETMEIFKSDKVIPTGLQHGTVTVLPKEYQKDATQSHDGYEITTFRADGDYSDGRHPDEVKFVTSLKEDLSRRDFTINAMAYSPSKGVVDPFNGIIDLKNHTLRCVGVAEERFSEDSLRIMRALRFAANYNLTIEESTDKAANSLAQTLDRVSKERITTELLKMFDKAEHPGEMLSSHREILKAIIPEIAECDGYDQKTPWHQYDVLTHSLKAVDLVDVSNLDKVDRQTARMGALLHDIGKPSAYTWDEKRQVAHFKGHPEFSTQISEEVLTNDFRITSDMKKSLLAVIPEHEDRRPATEAAARKLLNKLGEHDTKLLIEIQKADVISHGELAKPQMDKIMRDYNMLNDLSQKVNEVLESNMAFTIKDLAIRGQDLKEMGIKPGPIYTEILETLLDGVMEGNIPNDRDILMEQVGLYIEDELKETEQIIENVYNAYFPNETEEREVGD